MPAFFARVNQGKRSIVLDLRDPASHPTMNELLRWADVLVEGFRPGVMERLGFGPAHAHAIHPRLVYCRISAYGQTGPRSRHPAHDVNLQAATGFAHLERQRSGPSTSRLPLADLSASLVTVAAVQNALAGSRDRVVLDIAMADALQSWTEVWDTLDPGSMAEAASRRWPTALRIAAAPAVRRLRTHLRREKLDAMPGYGLVRTADGHLAIGIVDEGTFWRALMDVLDLPRHRDHGMVTRTLLGPLLRRRIARRVRTRSTAHWLTVCEQVGLPVTAVVGLEELAHDPHVVHRDRLGRGPLPASNRLPDNAPGLGEHTVSVLATILGTDRPAPS